MSEQEDAMSTAVCATSAPGTERTQRLVLAGVGWRSYQALGGALADHPGLRLTYDRGSLEFMTTSPEHEIYKKHLSRFIEILAEELDKPFVSAGQMTFESEEAGRGLEADDCFWFQYEPQMRGKLTWDPKVDPPPDLGMEIEITRSVLDRLTIYAALHVPEVWCCDGQSLRVLQMQPDGSYQQAAQSQVFPGVPLTELVRFLALARTADVLSVIRAFRQWVRSIRPG
jgi:Uma2 family endonuclease